LNVFEALQGIIIPVIIPALKMTKMQMAIMMVLLLLSDHITAMWVASPLKGCERGRITA